LFLKNVKDSYLDNEGDLSVKIFVKSNYPVCEEDIKDCILESDDSKMKIFIMR
jgi:hypothetical protein